MNKWIGIGNLGADPELKYTQNNTAVCNFSMATSERYKDKNGDNQTKTEWVRCVAWGRTAEVAGEYLSKGSKVGIEGKLQSRSWEDDSGAKRYITEVVILSLEMLDSQAKGSSKQAYGSKPKGYKNPEANLKREHWQTESQDDISF